MLSYGYKIIDWSSIQVRAANTSTKTWHVKPSLIPANAILPLPYRYKPSLQNANPLYSILIYSMSIPKRMMLIRPPGSVLSSEITKP